MSAIRSFKKTVIAFHRDLAPQKKDDIRRWVEHAGGKVTSEITDDVTHFILPRAIWHSDDAQVTEIRRRRTVFLIKFKWLSDSLSFNKKKPLDEVNQRYTWDVAHAKKVWDKRKDARRHKARMERAAAKEASKLSQVEGDKPSSSTIEAKVKKAQEIIECGLKYDKKLLECERDMALSGYRPYVDNNGFLYMVTLVRDDIVHNIKEKYNMKLYESFQIPMPELESPCAMTPDSTTESHTSFKTYLPSTSSLPFTEPPSPLHPTSSDARPKGTNDSGKEYRLVCHYTKRMGRHRSVQTEDLVPRHSTFEFVMEMWRKIFKNKTKITWNAALHGDANTTQRKDSGIALKDDGNSHNVERTVSVHRLQGQDHTTKYSEKDPGVPAILAKADIASTYQRQSFQYIPNLTENIAHFGKRYLDIYGENWLTSHCTELKEQSSKLPLLAHDNAIVPENKPEFLVCDDHVDTVCECVLSV
ncbi:hypothetical protein LTR05_002783 [Lithohypha guttulata]|uniref:BRCT domain-containing protein n=1 Tax=Lithohypha guttulata TaxID=1690604 RepID=A0AAN7T4V7_9EURO|nr:hypothetical protein LTR05_002783 [Lithohypha guttulata]